MSPELVRSVLITGTVGSGKTAVAQEAGALLEERDLPTAVIDLDWLGWVHATSHLVDSLITTNLRSVWANYLAAGVRYMVMTRAVDTSAQIEAIHEAVGAELKVVALEVSPEVAVERLRRRDTGSELAEHLEASPRMASAIAGLDVDHRIGNDDREIREVAGELLELLGWI